jgi:hypothetical protein
MQPKPLALGPIPDLRLKGSAAWLDLAANQAAWWWCILSARAGHGTVALLGPGAYLLGQFLLRRGERWLVPLLGALGTLVGLAGDTLLVRAELLVFPPGLTIGAVAPFMLALWAMFSVSLLGSMAFLLRQPAWLALLLGAAAGPIAYSGGERLSVLTLPGGAAVGVAVEWALAVPLLAVMARLLRQYPWRRA